MSIHDSCCNLQNLCYNNSEWMIVRHDARCAISFEDTKGLEGESMSVKSVVKKIISKPTTPSATVPEISNPDPTANPSTDITRPISANLYAAGWRNHEEDVMPSVIYGILPVVGTGNWKPIRIERHEDGSVSILALPENMKEIAVQRIIDLLPTEAR